MVHLATLPARERVLLPVLAEATGAPESFLSKVLQALSRAKLISSRRGQSGGFEILARGRKASMREVIEAIDGPLCLNVCLIRGEIVLEKGVVPGTPGLGGCPAGDAGCAARRSDRGPCVAGLHAAGPGARTGGVASR